MPDPLAVALGVVLWLSGVVVGTFLWTVLKYKLFGLPKEEDEERTS